MRRPVCVFCCCSVLTQLALVCLPQAAVWLLAAAFVFGCVAAWRVRRTMVPLVLVLAVLIGTVLFAISELRLRVPVQSLQDKTLRITAVVAQTEPSYEDGMVNAVLLVDSAGDKQNYFRVVCAALPQCRRGDVIEAVVTFSPVEGKTDRLRAYADGEFLQAEYRSGFQRTGQRWPLSLRLRQLGEECSDRLRRYLAPEEGAVLAAMVAGDNRFLSSRQSEVYRKAGVSHILVVSGLHLTLLCGLIPTPQRMTRRIRVVRALGAMGLAFLMMGIVGFTPSILRAGIAAIILHMGTLLYEPADSLTSLSLAVFGMSAFNVYAVCDLSLQLSATATLGVILSAQAIEPILQKLYERDTFAADRVASLLSAAVISAGAMICTFPVLVLWGLNVSTVALAANITVGWLSVPILFFGVLALICSAVPLLNLLYRPLVLLAALCVKLMNHLVQWFAANPFAQLHFATPYAAVVVLAVGIYILLLRRWKVPVKQCVAGLLFLTFAAAALGAVLSRNVVRVALVGNSWSPAVVLTQEGQAAVLYRGGTTNAQAVERYLEQRGIDKPEMVIDLRYSSGNPCPVTGSRFLSLAEHPKEFSSVVPWRGLRFTLTTNGSGGVVLIDLGGVTAAVVSGSAGKLPPITADLLLASSGSPGNVLADAVVAANKKYSWLDSYGAGKVYYGQSGITLEVRPQTSYHIAGAD